MTARQGVVREFRISVTLTGMYAIYEGNCLRGPSYPTFDVAYEAAMALTSVAGGAGKAAVVLDSDDFPRVERRRAVLAIRSHFRGRRRRFPRTHGA